MIAPPSCSQASSTSAVLRESCRTLKVFMSDIMSDRMPRVKQRPPRRCCRTARVCKPPPRRFRHRARFEMGRPTGAAPARRSSQDRMLAVTSRPPSESGGSRRSCSPSHEVERSVFETVPARLMSRARATRRAVLRTVCLARLSGSASVFEIGESPRCHPMLRGFGMRGAQALSSKAVEHSVKFVPAGAHWLSSHAATVSVESRGVMDT